MPALECKSVCLEYVVAGRKLRALQDVDVHVEKRELVSLLGPSGCGKSTLLNIVAGFLTPTGGTVTVDGEKVRKPGKDRGVIFQEHALFPWMTVNQNIGFGLDVNGVARKEREERTLELLKLVNLVDFASAFPSQLSGGMRQRVAICRALANYPSILLMDEPFSAIDEQTRQGLRDEFLRIWQITGQTVLLVTHSIDEAIIMSDRIVVMGTKPGRVLTTVDIDLPRPRDDLSAGFIALKKQISGLLYRRDNGAVQ
ncbi:MAG: ABC transporter ATP-binding protein [Rhizobiaceae bacterium]